MEITFGAIKQKIGEMIMSRNFHAQVNELLCKVIAHNITMLIQAMFNIGVLPDFLEPADRNCVASPVRQNLEMAERPEFDPVSQGKSGDARQSPMV